MPAVSEDFLQAFLRSALIFLGMPVSQQEEENMVHTKFKLWNVVIFHGLLTRNMPLQDIIDIWDQASTIVNQDAVVRLASHTGANVNPDFAIRHFTTCGPDEKTTASFVFVRATHGGGPSEPKVANKHDFHVQQRNALASFMIQQGADIQDCIRCIESLIRGAGAEAISTIMNLKHPGKKWESLVQLSEALGIKTPEIANKVDRARKKIVGKFQEQAKSLLRNLPIESLTLQPGFLCKCDESDCIQLPRVTPNSCGVVLSSYDDAKEWLSNGSVISQDEFSLIVVGKCDHTEKAECQKVQLPVLLNQEPLVISGCLHHLGAKRASVCIDAQYDFPVTDTQVIAVTAYKDEFSEDLWNAVVRSPVKQIMQLLSKEAGDVDMLAPPWGRSFHRATKKCDPVVATSVQIHIRVAKSEMRRILKASGCSGVYCTPKTEDRKILADFMIIWLNQTPVDFAGSLSRVDFHCGVVRSSKGDSSSKGVRFEKADYLKAFALLKPDEKLPGIVVANHHFKIAPTPLGSTQEQVQLWLEAQMWEAKPLKPLSGTCWLCIAEKRFDTLFAQWNGCPVLVTWLDDKKGDTPIVLAGTVQAGSVTKQADSSKMALSANGNALIDDPWGSWISNRGSTGLINQQSRVAQVPLNAQPPRKLESPIEDRFARHDGALQDLRCHTDKEIESIRESLARMEKSVESQSMQMQSNLEQTNAEFKAIRTETANQFHAMSSMFAESLKTSIASQESQISSQFAELKEMIMMRSSGSGASPPQKKPKKNRDADDSL